MAEHGWDSLANCFSFLNWLINEIQASARTSFRRLYADIRAQAHPRHIQPIVHLWPEASAMDAMAVPCAHLLVFICCVPHITLTLPQVHKWGHFLWSERLKIFFCCCPRFLPFQERVLRFQWLGCKVRRTRQTVPRACQVFWTLNTASSLFIELPKAGSWS